MKKFVVLCLTLVMLASLSLTAFAAPGSFVSSPSGNPAPILDDYDAESENCFAKLEVTPYSERDKLDEESRKNIEEAYKHISKQEENKSFEDAMKKLAEENDLSESDLAVSDLFDLDYYNCDIHESDDHKGFTVTLKAETLENVVGLLYFDGKEWKAIKIIEHNAEKGTVTFFTEDLGCFAFVVNKYLPPYTGDNSAVNLLIIVAAAGALTLMLAARPKKRES